ncbi:hypothetical protein B0H11DRAFT_2399054 [Mycena galericulata]|nr:hypothetical protein B0H11DRAFT_2399054 [Mycena galericulata]
MATLFLPRISFSTTLNQMRHRSRIPKAKACPYSSAINEFLTSPSEPRRSTRQRQTDRLTASLAAEKQDENGDSIPVKARPVAGRKVPRPSAVVSSSDEDDGDFSGSDSGEDSDSCPSLMSLDNEEIAAMLPSKTFPSKASRSTADPRKEEQRKSKNAKARERAKKRKHTAEAGGAPPRKRATVEEVEDEGDDPRRGNGSVNARTPRTKNLIYLFYEAVDKGADGTSGSPGDKHFKCYHGNRKVLTITRAMKSSLNGLQTHLRTKFPIMNRLYDAISHRQTPPTQEEIDLARGATVMDAAAAAKYLGKVKAVTANIVKLFEAQSRASTGEWDQAKFEALLTDTLTTAGTFVFPSATPSAPKL